jgi:hypothetical protein
MTARPAPTEYAPFYETYVSRVPEEEILPALASQVVEIRRFAAAVPAEREGHRYAPGKWSVREVLGHLADGERLFGYRALCIGRGDRQPLPGFDEQAYMADSGFDQVRLADLAEDFAAARESNLRMLSRFAPDAWRRVGTANSVPVSARALAWIMAGHVRHHLAVLQGRYGVGAGA